MITLKINVTSRCILQGKATSLRSCAIALALKDSFPSVEVGDSAVFLGQDGYPAMIELPPVAQNFIKDFDRQIPVSPIEFNLFWE